MTSKSLIVLAVIAIVSTASASGSDGRRSVATPSDTCVVTWAFAPDDGLMTVEPVMPLRSVLSIRPVIDRVRVAACTTSV